MLGEEYVSRNSGFDPSVTGITVNTKSIKFYEGEKTYYSIVREGAMLLVGYTTIQHRLKINALDAHVQRISYQPIT